MCDRGKGPIGRGSLSIESNRDEAGPRPGNADVRCIQARFSPPRGILRGYQKHYARGPVGKKVAGAV